MGDHGSDDYCHHARDIRLHIREWFDERKPDGDDDLHADCNERLRLDHRHGTGHCYSLGRSFGDNDHLVPRRDTGRCVYRLHNRCQRWLSTVHLFREYECQLSTTA